MNTIAYAQCTHCQKTHTHANFTAAVVAEFEQELIICRCETRVLLDGIIYIYCLFFSIINAYVFNTYMYRKKDLQRCEQISAQ